jgi:hypothetical protein
MITWGLNLKKQTMASNVIKGLRNYTRVNKSNFAKSSSTMGDTGLRNNRGNG